MHLALSSRWRTLRPAGLALAVLVAGGVLAACSSSPSASPTTTTTTTSPTTTTTPTSASSTTTPSSTPTCATSALTVAAAGSGGSAGAGSETFTLTNTGASSCSLDGYASLAFFGPSAAGGAGAGPELDITDSDGGGPAITAVLAPKATASFLVQFPQVPVNGAGCVSIASVQVVPPGNSQSLQLPLSVQNCGSSVTVDPVSAGTSGT